MARKAQRAGRDSRLGCWELRTCGRRGAATRGARAEACKARAERSGRGRQARAAGERQQAWMRAERGARPAGRPGRAVGPMGCALGDLSLF